MRVLSALVALGSLLVSVAVVQPRQERLAYPQVCDADAEVRRGAILAAIARDIDAATSPGGSAAEAERARREELARRVEALRPRAQDVFDGVVASARESLVRPGSGVSEEALDRLRTVHLRWIDPRDPSPREGRALRRGCGNDLLADDAWVDKTGSEVVLCPGLLLVAEAEGHLREGLAFLIAHELGHVIVGPRATGEHAERIAESEADRWGARILQSMLDPRTTTATARFLRATLEPICAPKGDATHASGPDRVRAVLRELTG